MSDCPPPLRIELEQRRRLRVEFADHTVAALSADALRDASPAADGAPDAPSSGVMITGVEPVGNYAVKLVFSDGHQSGIYNWGLLYKLARQARQGQQGQQAQQA